MGRTTMIRLELGVLLVFSAILSLSGSYKSLLELFLMASVLFLAEILFFGILMKNADGWPGRAWLNEAVDEILSFLFFVFIYLIIYPIGWLAIKLILAPADQRETDGKWKEKISFIFLGIIRCCSWRLFEVVLKRMAAKSQGENAKLLLFP